MSEKVETEETISETTKDRKISIKKERQVLSRNAKPKPHTKKEMKERRIKKRQKEEERLQ